MSRSNQTEGRDSRSLARLFVILAFLAFLGGAGLVYRQWSETDWPRLGQMGDFWGGHINATASLAAMFMLGAGVCFQHFEIRMQLEANRDQAEKTRQTNEFTAIVAVHDRLSSPDSYRARSYLNTDFPRQFGEIVRKTVDFSIDPWLSLATKEAFLNMTNKLKPNPEILKKMRQSLRGQSSEELRGGSFDPLAAVERAITDADIFAVPLSLEIEAIDKVLFTHKALLTKTAEQVLPFVAIQMRLRGQPDYKRSFLKMLCTLGVTKAGWLIEVGEQMESETPGGAAA